MQLHHRGPRPDSDNPHSPAWRGHQVGEARDAEVPGNSASASSAPPAAERMMLADKPVSEDSQPRQPPAVARVLPLEGCTPGKKRRAPRHPFGYPLLGFARCAGAANRETDGQWARHRQGQAVELSVLVERSQDLLAAANVNPNRLLANSPLRSSAGQQPGIAVLIPPTPSRRTCV